MTKEQIRIARAIANAADDIPELAERMRALPDGALNDGYSGLDLFDGLRVVFD